MWMKTRKNKGIKKAQINISVQLVRDEKKEDEIKVCMNIS